MKLTTLVVISTLFFFSCKVVEIDKQPIKTTVENTPTVTVANFPTSSGTSNVNAKITNSDSDPVPVKVINQSSTSGQRYTYTTISGGRGLSFRAPSTGITVINYVHVDDTGNEHVILTAGRMSIKLIQNGSRNLAQPLSIVVPSGETAMLSSGTLNSSGFTMTYHVITN